MASICIMCSRDTVPGKRRKLSSYDDVVFMLKDVAKTIGGLSAADAAAEAVIMPNDSMLCRSCLNRLQRILKLEREVQEIRLQVQDRMRQIGISNGILTEMQHTVVQSEDTSAAASGHQKSPLKRPAAQTSGMPVRKRLKALFHETIPVDAPILDTTIPTGTSPSVVVRHACMLLIWMYKVCIFFI